MTVAIDCESWKQFMVTLQDIADRTGFSRAVVSRALNPRPDQKVAERTRDIIQRTAEEMGYVRNQAASLLAKGASPGIGVFVPGAPDALFCSLIHGVCRVANRHGFSYNIYSGIASGDYMDFFNTVRNARNAGIITYLPYNFIGDDLPEMLENLLPNGCRIVVANSPVPIKRNNVDSVMIDNYRGGCIAAEHLLERGCRSFFMENPRRSWQQRERVNGFSDTISLSGAAVSVFDRWVKDGDLNNILDNLIAQIKKTPGPCGVFCTVDDTAVLLIMRLQHAGLADELGKRIKIIGFDDIALAEQIGLTSIAQPFGELGESAMSLLVNHLTDAGIKVPSRRLLPVLKVRKTT